MVSAYNLHFDILGLIFAHLSGNDLVNVALVSKAFLSGVTPRLYHTIVFSHSQAKRYPKIMSPFALVLAQPSLGVHVRVCNISAFPLYKGQPNQAFLSESIRALLLCHNLSSFTLLPSVLPSFLVVLATGTHKLRTLHVQAGLTPEQAAILIEMRNLKSLRVDRASWCIMHLFPMWVVEMEGLTSLAITLTPELSESTLRQLLTRLPHLRSLTIRKCMNVDHETIFHLLKYTPRIENLSITTWESHSTSIDEFALVPNLRSLHLDTLNSLAPLSVTPLWLSIFSHTAASRAPLTSITLQLAEKNVLVESVLQALLDAHAGTLKELRLVRVGLDLDGVKKIREMCARLERLCIAVPVREIEDFAQALAGAPSLRVLVEEPDPHTSHGPRQTLKHTDVTLLMRSCPRLRTVISDGRCWKGTGNGENMLISLERLKGAGGHTMNFT